ncbi:MAG: CDP-alcohol phosphatidyltransferase family protein [Actinobacteria bacterium]|nr:CDP-alcohol phosphatidyltransferase family protein [Actinomycetota bacterium]
MVAATPSRSASGWPIRAIRVPFNGELTPRAYDVTTMISSFLRAPVARVVEPAARALIRRNITPNQITVLGSLGTILIAATFFTQGELFWGTMAMLIFIFSDLVDGTMARIGGLSSKWGAFLDSTADRIVDAAVMGSVAYFLFLEGNRLHAIAWCALAGGYLVSYVKARAEAGGFTCDGGFAERPERMIILLVSTGFAGLGVPYILAIGIWLLTITSLLTAIFRIRQVWRQR